MIYLITFLIIVLIIGVYLYAIRPKKVDSSLFSPFLERHFAHRGLHKEKNVSPENSLLAFQLAVENDYGIELDVQLSRDNIPIVFHDYDLNRVCGIDKKINDCDYENLKDINLYNSEQKIPTLKEVLDLVDGKVPLIIELKGETKDISVCKFIEPILDNYKGIYAIESFNPYMLKWYKENKREIIRGQLSKKMDKKGLSTETKLRNFALENLLLNFLAKPHFIAFKHQDSSMFSFNLCKKVYKPLTIAYTIQSQEDLEKNKDKFDLFIFDKFIPE